MVSITNLSKSYGKNQVLKSINLNLNKGKVYGIVGENGAGKTTLFRCIAGLEDYEGTIDADVKNIKNHLGFLPTNPIFMSRITGWEYLKLLSIARNIQWDRFEEKNIFELPLGQYVETYSTGMKKKLALMGILLQKNDIFILDEPFNGVDIHSNFIITEIIKQLKSLNKTIIISSHIFSTLSDTCDEIRLLKEGIFAKSVEKADFKQLDADMRTITIGNKIEKLKLT